MKETITAQIEKNAFQLLGKTPEGLQWSQLNKMIKESNPKFHPKTINGIVWKLPEKYQDRVYKPSKGIFRLTKYKD